jgi:hypothetical protein
MEDRDEKDGRLARLGALARRKTHEVGRRTRDSLQGVGRSVAEVGDRLKSSPATQQVGAAVDSWRLVKKATEAQRRGNHAMAYRLLEPKVHEDPSDTRTVLAFFHAAVACERADDAAPFMTGVIRGLVREDKAGRAAELWTELHAAVPSAHVDPAALVRIAEVLEAEGAAEGALEALRDAVDVDATGLSPGLAVRIAEMARDLDPPTAHRALWRALEAPGLDQAKRSRLEELERELRAATPEAPSSPHPSPALGADPLDTDSNPGPVSDGIGALADRMAIAAIDATDPVARFRDAKIREAMPVELKEEGIALRLRGSRRARIEYSKVEAIAVAEVRGLGPHSVRVIDLLLNWNSDDDPTLRVVRIRGDGFDPRMVFEAPGDDSDALADFVSELVGRCDAVTLPHSRSADPGILRNFESLEAYECEVLQVERHRGPA